ncbi:MAG: PASTA domain-containing protein [Ruminococcaceae bacterium]|nr:PASTA domain-containing protein [Oscillospiraceae bacterium]
MSKSPSAVIKTRILLACIAVCFVGFSILFARLFQLMILDSEEYQRQAAENQLKVTTIAANRGSIYDRNGNKLAMSTTAWTVCVSPKEIKNENEKALIISGLSEILGTNQDYIREKCERNNYYQVIKTRIGKDLAEEVTAFASNNGIKAIYLQEDVSRKYPYENFASTVIGFVNDENIGAYGLESFYNGILSGTAGKLVSAKDSWGQDMPFEHDELYSSEDGNSIQTTLDEGIQYFVEKHLELAVKEHSVRERGACIVMDVNTGAILAMATKGDFDPNAHTVLPESVKEEILKLPEDEQGEATLQAQYAMWRNKTISDPYEPGSVFKIITLAAALDSNTSTLGDHFTCIGYANVADRKISCWQNRGHGDQTLADAVQNSCNPAFIEIGLRMGVENFENYFEAFGLTEKTGIDLPGEATSIYYSDGMTEINLASSSFGQTFKVTPIQLVTAVSAAVNGGNLYKPYVVSKVISEDGSIVEEYEPTLVRQVISEETSKTVREILETVVSDGSGRTAAVPGYKIGGKTGTSEKLDKVSEEGEVENYVSSFLAVAPAYDPQIVVLLLLDEAQMENPYGSVVAAPVVGAMLADILPYMGIEPNYTEAELEAMTGKVKDVTGQLVHDAMTTLRIQGYSVTVVGEGTTVVAQSPEAKSLLDAGGTITLYTDESLIPKEIEVPNVEGMSVTEVNNAIIGAGLRLKLIGVSESATDQVAYSQTPAAGEKVMPGTIIEVSFTINTEEPEENG